MNGMKWSELQKNKFEEIKVSALVQYYQKMLESVGG